MIQTEIYKQLIIKYLRMKKFLLLALSFTAVFACKEEKQIETTTNETTAPVIVSPPEDSTTDSKNVALEITGDDAMKFDKNELRIAAGSEVTLTLHHSGKMSAESMGHNWVLLKEGTNVQDFAMEAISAKDNDYVPEGTTAVIAHTKVIGGGETTSITFTAPEKGTYDFICSFPGHFASMKGKFIVE